MATPLPALLARRLAVRLQTMRRRYRKRLERCQRRFSETAVHDLRVETRRLLAMLDLLRDLQFGHGVRKTRKELKRRLDAFDALRDTHVCLARLKPLRREVPEARALDPLWRRQERRLVAALRREIKATKQARLRKRLKALERALADSGAGTSREASEALARAALGEAFAQLAALRRRIRRHAPATIHRLRVACKKARYKGELLESLLPKPTLKNLQRLRVFQAQMGEIQDMEVLLAAVALAANEQRLPLPVARCLRKTLRQRRRAAIDHFLHTADELSALDPSFFTAARRSVKSSSP